MKQDVYYEAANGSLPTSSGYLYLRVVFTYRPEDPVALGMKITPVVEMPDGSTRWLNGVDFWLSRDLVDAAFLTPGEQMGDGDIRLTYIPEEKHKHWATMQVDMLSAEGVFYPSYIEADPLLRLMEVSVEAVSQAEESTRISEALDRLTEADEQ